MERSEFPPVWRPDGIRTRVSALKGIVLGDISSVFARFGYQTGHHAGLDDRGADDVDT
jgi:hypothetical protein